MKKLYSHIILLAIIVALVIPGTNTALAVETGTSTMTLSANTSYGAPGAVYLPDENAYLIIRVEGRDGCANNQQIVGQKVDAITGNKIGTEAVLAQFDDICGSEKKLIQNFDIVYNESSDELLLVYQKSTGNVFLDHILYAQRFAASNLSPSDSEVEVGPISSGFYLNIFAIYHQLSSSYYIGYEKKVGAQNNQVFIKNLDANSNSLTDIELSLEKTDFNVANNFGPSKSKMIRNSLLNEFLMILELQHDNGSEIYGLRLNNSMEVIGDEFRISDSGSNNEFYKSSNIAFNSEKNQFAIIYEKHSDGNEEIAENIFAQIISANNYDVILSNQKEISNIPCSGCFEFSKHPEILYSPFKNQFVTAFFASPTFDYANDRFNVYVQNLSDDNLNLLTTSNNSISSGSGTTVSNYSGLPKLGTAYNHKNNQFLISWLDDNTKNISYQIRRYINNNPSSLDLSANQIAENVATGTPIGNLTAYDPDPEDTFTFSLVPGDGSTHNNDFQLNGTQLEVKNSPNFEDTKQKSIRLRTTDSKSGTLEKIIMIDIADVNDAPTGVLSSSNSLDENLANNSTIALLTANDEDISDQHSFELVSGTGDDDNNLFSINGNSLISSSPLNYEEKNQISIRVSTTDQGGLSSQQILTFDVNDINDRPTDINIANNVLEENTSAGTVAGNLYPVDEDLNDSHSFSILPVAGIEDHQFFEISGSSILNTSPLNFEEKSSYSIKVLMEDQGGQTIEKTIEINVLDRNDPPNGLISDTLYYAENNSPSVNIALLEAEDEDIDDEHIFSKLSSSPDDIAFYFLGDNKTLKTDSVFNYEQKDHYQIYIEINDGSLTTTDTLNIIITDANDQPQKVYLDQYSFPELNQSGLTVANILVEDEDISDTYSFELFQGLGDFMIEDGQLKTNKIFESSRSPTVEVGIRVIDQGGLSKDTVLTLTVEEFFDEESPVIQNIVRPSIMAENTVNGEISASDNSGLFDVVLHYIEASKFNATNWNSQEVDGNEGLFEFSFNNEWVDELGLLYVLEAVDRKNNRTLSDTFFLPRSYQNLSAPKISDLRYGGTLNSYEMISIPFNLNSDDIEDIIGDDLGQQRSDKWRLLHYDQGSLKEFPKNLDVIEKGKGYWFNKVSSQAITLGNANTSFYDPKTHVVLQLKKGFNQIGNPYPFDINWNEVVSYSKNKDKFLDRAIDIALYQYDGQSFVENTILKAFRGAFVFCERDVELVIPPFKTSGNGRLMAKNDRPLHWQIEFLLSGKGSVTEKTTLGMHPEADDFIDALDRKMAPPIDDQQKMYSRNIDFFYPFISRDVVRKQNKYTWNITIELRNDKPYQLEWLQNEVKEAYLYHLNSREIIDLQQQEQLSIQGAGNHELLVIFGDRKYVQSVINEAHVIAMTPYPNPFVDQMTVPVFLPKSYKTYDIDISIFDLSGRVVLQKNWNHVNNGLQKLHLNDMDSHQLSKGVYLYNINIKQDNQNYHQNGRIIKQ